MTEELKFGKLTNRQNPQKSFNDFNMSTGRWVLFTHWHVHYGYSFFFNFIKDWVKHMAWNERTKCLAACSSNGWIKVNCRWSFEWACHVVLVVFLYRFGQWTATNPFTPQRSITNVIVLLGVQTGNKRTARESTLPGNWPTISFWPPGISLSTDWVLWEIGDWTNRIDSLFAIRPRSEFLDSPFLAQEKWIAYYYSIVYWG
jgi:hypothetical protein